MFAKTSRRRHLDFLERDPRAIFHEGEQYSFGISLDDLRFSLGNDGRAEGRNQMKNKTVYMCIIVMCIKMILYLYNQMASR